MASIESALGSIVSEDVKQMKRFVVDDPTQNQQQEDLSEQNTRELLNKVNEFRRTQTNINQDKKNKLEILLGLKKIKKNIIIDGHNIVLQNLSSGDMKCAFRKIADNDKAVDQMFDTRHIFLAYSLYSFDGETISNLLAEDDDLETRLSLIENMSESLVKELYDFYTQNFEIHPKTEDDFKEVNSDLKK